MNTSAPTRPFFSLLVVFLFLCLNFLLHRVPNSNEISKFTDAMFYLDPGWVPALFPGGGDFGSRILLSDSGLELQCVRHWNFLALLPYLVVGKVLKRGVDDGLRYSSAEERSIVTGPLLRWWYQHVERHIRFPIGLSLYAEAGHKGSSPVASNLL